MTSLSAASRPMSSRGTSLKTIRSARLAASLARAPPRLGRERGSHVPGRAVAEEADRVQRLARATRGDEDAQPLEMLALLDQRGTALEDRVRLAHPPDADLALRRVAVLGTDQVDPAAAQ